VCNGIFAAGYPRITSGVMQNPKKLTEIHTALFPTVNDDDEPWLHNENCFITDISGKHTNEYNI